MTFQDDHLTIETPENVAFGYPVAGIGSRFIAALVDSAIIVILQIAVFLLTILIAQRVFELDVQELAAGGLAGWVFAGLGLVSFLFLWGYYIFFESLWNGQSPGKRWTGLRVIRGDGRPVTLTESVIRNLVRLIDFLPSLYGVGVVVMFIDSRARRLGDMAAGTLVVREDPAGAGLEALLGVERRMGPGSVRLEGIGELPLEKLGPAEIDLIDSFVNRRSQFSHPDVIGRQVLERVFEKMEIRYPFLDRWDTTNLIVQIRSALAHQDEGKWNTDFTDLP